MCFYDTRLHTFIEIRFDMMTKSAMNPRPLTKIRIYFGVD